MRSAITFLIGIAIFAGFPLVCSGVDDVQGFAGDPARLSYLILVILLNAFAAIRIPEVGKKPAEAKTTLRRQHAAVVLMQVISIGIVIIAPFCDRRSIATLADAVAIRYPGLPSSTVSGRGRVCPGNFPALSFGTGAAAQRGDDPGNGMARPR